VLKYLISVLVMFFLCIGCVAPTYVTKHGLRIFDDVGISQKKIEAATEMLLQTLNEDSKTISGTDVRIYRHPLCLQFGSTMFVADGYTAYTNFILWVKKSVSVSTVRGCFDGLVHELGHIIQVKRTNQTPYTKLGNIHKDLLYWKTITSVAKWTVGELCDGIQLEISPDVCE